MNADYTEFLGKTFGRFKATGAGPSRFWVAFECTNCQARDELRIAEFRRRVVTGIYRCCEKRRGNWAGEKAERNAQVFARKTEGLSYSQIGAEFGISKSRAEQIFRGYCQKSNADSARTQTKEITNAI